ncbi:MAG: hypothetical protein KBG47_02715 [Bacteroidia bacterium]|nr:hypothetical protein [Bacteroidia bacterium]
MTEQNIIDFVVEKLIKYPDIKYDKKSDSELEIFCRDEQGFDILLQLDQRENTLHFGTFHWHFDNNEEETDEMLNQLVFGLTGIARLKELSKNGKAYKWTLQIQDREGNWFDNGTMGRMNFNFWTKTDIKYLQNDLLPKDILYADNETEQ